MSEQTVTTRRRVKPAIGRFTGSYIIEHREGYHGHPCMLVEIGLNRERGEYWKPGRDGYTDDRDEAGIEDNVVIAARDLGDSVHYDVLPRPYYDEAPVVDPYPEAEMTMVWPMGKPRLHEEFLDRWCLIRVADTVPAQAGWFWREPGLGNNPERGHAFPWPVRAVLDMALTHGTKVDVLPASFKPLKFCTLNQVLPRGVIELIRSQPENEVFRTIVLTHIKIPLPDECKTFDQIKDWIESNINPHAPRPVVSTEGDPLRDVTFEEIVIDPPTRGPAIAIVVEANQRASGTARFSGREYGHGNIHVPLDALIDMAGEADSWEDLMDRIENYIEDNHSVEEELDMTVDAPNAEYTHLEVDDTEDFGWNIQDQAASITRIREALQTHAPEIAQNL